MTNEDRRPVWLRGVLDFCLLALLADGEAYGYELARRLEEHGLGTVPGGSLYPALLRREKLGHLRAEWRAGEGGPGRKYYAITPTGRAALEREAVAWRGFAAGVEATITGVAAR
ncbi:PadR family transcriptional regulator [Conexibacter woesei]|uniref:Transcriptional regulator, PadR-like family n=1 Tax=Conexibacter woesei (strain DSM 14684 / CCUG 47730 / CIP 108061 / JCM 11494 / NBRC 100937 / ID131577) TaxID=469383 RepID=D3FBE8_CONWI|nr:PadR family transcriptional regulator [Conexibacter woesei]ADB49317.1 transcriptional regulator, PadR-like family [Conexibacter woesei DSM 14684]